MHVILIYRHALLELDGVESTNVNPKVITEHFFVISDNDEHFTHFVQKQVNEYLKSISYHLNTMHEFVTVVLASKRIDIVLGI